MAFILDNLAQSLIVLGILALVIEVAVLGFATFVLLFLGLSLIFCGTMMYAGLLTEDWLTALWVNALLTFVLALLLWKPLLRLQQSSSGKALSSDFADIDFVLEADLDENSKQYHSYSGIQWQLKSEQPLSKGTRVKVVKKDVGVMWVKAI
ncbi:MULTISPECIES: activity regulator of membrane protease YbbK [Pseudoalteromonas]|uniref:Activity regulator of membrane protease YbbK n=1 Tax=Pseudoalteromonas amylolytica TaxID=1859457 RepID=A0A1S1MKK9_9GAMM|nr:MULTISPECIES: activity regulator of membrane protease YbbK [Pseudoalteromonas]OHU84249.1 activity regulator of membrane protease YbbK [Pseudoalteromonas sp. JW3]OHU87210.1 activity regulator of membrane protease YbbK [Pseudoalteromonas amylolytica]